MSARVVNDALPIRILNGLRMSTIRLQKCRSISLLHQSIKQTLVESRKPYIKGSVIDILAQLLWHTAASLNLPLEQESYLVGSTDKLTLCSSNHHRSCMVASELTWLNKMDELFLLERNTAPGGKLDCETTRDANKLTHFPSFNGLHDIQGLPLHAQTHLQQTALCSLQEQHDGIGDLWNTKESNKACHKISKITFPGTF